MRPLFSLFALLPIAALACGPATPDPHLGGTESNAAPAPGQSAPAGADRTVVDVDPVTTSVSVDGMKRICDEHLKAAQDLVDRIKSLKGAPPEKLTYAATLGRLDQVSLQIAEGGQLPYLMAVA